MRRPRTSRIAVAAAAAGLVTVLGAPAAVAQTAEYNGGTDTAVLGNVRTTTTTTARPAGRTASTTSTLPFTGGEVTLLALAGAGAVAAGTAMVVGGRRRAGATG